MQYRAVILNRSKSSIEQCAIRSQSSLSPMKKLLTSTDVLNTIMTIWGSVPSKWYNIPWGHIKILSFYTLGEQSTCSILLALNIHSLIVTLFLYKPTRARHHVVWILYSMVHHITGNTLLENLSETFNCLIRHQHTSKQHILEMIVYPNKQSKWHIIQICLVCCVKSDYIPKWRYCIRFLLFVHISVLMQPSLSVSTL